MRMQNIVSIKTLLNEPSEHLRPKYIFERVETGAVYHFRGFKLGLTTSVVSLLSKSIKSRRAKNLRFEIDIAKSHLQKEGEDDRQLGRIQSF